MTLQAHRFCRGAVLGLQQSSVRITVRLEPLSSPQQARLEQRMRDRLREDFPEPEERPDETPLLALARRCAQWAGALQRKARVSVSPVCAVRATGEPATVELAVPCLKPELALEAVSWTLSQASAAATPSEAGQTEEEFQRLMASLRAGAHHALNAFLIADAAYALQMPVQRPLHGVLTIGSGARARWFNSTITERTSAIGVRVARDKTSTAALLRRAGLPGAVHAVADTGQKATTIASRLGYPVVVKPADRDQGQGVAADLRNPAQVLQAFEQARALSSRVLVEKHCRGFTHRLTVVNGVLVKVARRVAGGVIGDGVHDIAALVRLAGEDPERQRRAARSGRRALELDEEARGLLAQDGMDERTVPSQGAYVRLRRRDNVNAGGSNVAVALETVHPDNRELAIRAAALLHLDLAGVDLIIDDIARSWLDTESLICEINAQPQMGVSDTPGIYRDLLRDALPDGGRIPVCVAVTVVPDRLSVEDLLARARPHVMAQTVACEDGLFIDGIRRTRGFASGFDAATAALTAPGTSSLLFLMSAEELQRDGLPIDRVDRIALIGSGEADAQAREQTDQALALVAPNCGSVEHW